MKKNIKRVVVTLLTTVALTSVVPATSAFAMSRVNCGNNTDFLMTRMHWASGPDVTDCYANAGEYDVRDMWGRNAWLKFFSTGNNRVQFYADGRWQPDSGVDKWTEYSFPNHPGGVSVSTLRIL